MDWFVTIIIVILVVILLILSRKANNNAHDIIVYTAIKNFLDQASIEELEEIIREKKEKAS